MAESSKKIFKMNYGDKKFNFGFDYFTESQLTTMLEKIIVSINKKKAKKENTVDVGFWDKDGNYEEDIQEITPEEKSEIDNGKRFVELNRDERICKILDEDDEYFYVQGAYSDFFIKKSDCREVLVVYKD